MSPIEKQEPIKKQEPFENQEPLENQEQREHQSVCAQKGCSGEGVYRAPVDRTGRYKLFCLKHVKIHNRNWNYFAGMSQGEVRSYDRAAATHMKPSWKWGRIPMAFLRYPMSGNRANSRTATRADTSHLPPKVEAALELLSLKKIPTLKQLKASYHRLVKLNHPDSHNGKKIYIEKLQGINNAYKVLVQWINKTL